jgi:predicted aspartyl protease
VKRAMLLILLVLSISRWTVAADSSVPFELRRGYLIVVQCSIGELANLTCIIDTGVSESVVDMRLVRRLSLATRVDSAMFLIQEVPVVAVSIPSLHLGPLRTGLLAGIATDLSSLTVHFGIRPDVLIGMDVLHQANFVIDYKARQILFTASPVLRHRVSLASDPRLALVESTIMGQRLLLQVDTGFHGLLLYGRRSGTPAGLAYGKSFVENAARTLTAVGLDSSEVRIGNWRASQVEVSILERAPRETLDFDGVIGAQVLRARRIAFDFDTNTLSWD